MLADFFNDTITINDPAELSQLFSHGPMTPHQASGAHNTPGRIRTALDCLHYSVTNLSPLFAKLIASHDSHSSDVQDLTLRFLVDADMKLLLAHEGRPSRGIPAHMQMTQDDSWITAGNIQLKLDGHTQQLTLSKINHQSGGLCPSFDSLKWALAILTMNRFPMEPRIIVEQLSGGGAVLRRYSLDSTVLRSWALSTFTEAESARFTDQPIIAPIPFASPEPAPQSQGEGEDLSKCFGRSLSPVNWGD